MNSSEQGQMLSLQFDSKVPKIRIFADIQESYLLVR